MTAEEKKYILVLFTLFFIQGIPLGFGGGISLILAGEKATMGQ
jgi:hypothetical protein